MLKPLKFFCSKEYKAILILLSQTTTNVLGGDEPKKVFGRW